MKIGLIFGGRSTEHRVSVVSARTIAQALEAAGHEVVPVAIGQDGSWQPVAVSEGALAGEVEVLRETEDGEVRLAILGAGDFFGEMSIFEHEVRSATVRARGEARVLTVDKRTLLKRIKEDPFLAVGILQTMSNRLREINAELVRARTAAAASTTTENPELEIR